MSRQVNGTKEKEYARFNALILGALVVLILLLIFKIPVTLVTLSCTGEFCIEPLHVVAILPVIPLLVIAAVGTFVSIIRIRELRI